MIENLKIWCLILVFWGSLGAAEKVDFNGEWYFDKSKSVFADGGDRFVPFKLSVSHDDSTMIVERTYQREYTHDYVDTLSFTLDARDNFSTMWNSSRIISARWANDGQALTIRTQIISERDGQQSQMISTDIWTLANNGAEINRDFTIDGPWGEMKAVYVFSTAKSLGNSQIKEGIQ